MFHIASKPDFSITLAAPEIPAGNLVALRGGWSSGSYIFSITSAVASSWIVVKERAAQVFCTITGQLEFLRRSCRKTLQKFRVCAEILCRVVAPARRVYAFRL